MNTKKVFYLLCLCFLSLGCSLKTARDVGLNDSADLHKLIEERAGHFADFMIFRKDIKESEQISSILELRIINAWDVQDSAKNTVAKSIAGSIKNNQGSSKHFDLYRILFIKWLYAGGARVSSEEFVFKENEL